MKIDETYATSDKWKGRKYLPFVIEQAPKEYSKEEIDGNFDYFNDEKIVFKFPNKAIKILISKILFYAVGIMFIILSIRNLTSGTPTLNAFLIDSTICLIPFLFGLHLKVKASNAADYEYVGLHRLFGLIELPSIKEGQHFFIRFEDLRALHTSYTTSIYYSGKIIAFIRDAAPYTPSKFLKIFLGRFTYDWIEMSWSSNPMEYWSFYVWYMDKNRPLPPGSAFDAYRQRDYERRKAEGFPPPLYDSVIPTPENPLDTRHVESVSPNS